MQKIRIQDSNWPKWSASTMPSKKNELSKVYVMVQFEPLLLNSRYKEKLSPLLEASFKGHHKLVEFFLDNGSDPNEVGSEGYTALMMASLGCHYDTMLSLLEAGANVSAKNSIGKTAAMLCGFVGLKHAHRILNCWIEDVSFLNDWYLKENISKPEQRQIRRLICHPNCLPISVLKRIGSISHSKLTNLVVALEKQAPVEPEFPYALRYTVISNTLKLMLKHKLSPLKFQKVLIKSPELFNRLIMDSCSNLSKRSETEGIKKVVNSGHAALSTAVRTLSGDTAGDLDLCCVCFEPSTLKCARCTHMNIVFCSRHCQKLAWKKHKPFCHLITQK